MEFFKKSMAVVLLSLSIFSNLNSVIYADGSKKNYEAINVSLLQDLETVVNRLENLNKNWRYIIERYQKLIQERDVLQVSLDYKAQEEAFYRNTLEELRIKLYSLNKQKLAIQNRMGEAFVEQNISKLNLNWFGIEQQWHTLE